ncbi:Cdc6/Cdc18 family protein [Natrinema hispanicum]|uniref:ORC1-type DNA replication protein n=1 Tax=Natrinema hispanicum TaxID=392421 RepID=A0A1I0JJ11_9EURY|nr:AAA family ATPase [Natrinema hispanicum]RZV06420.1 cell division control protein 6 [Natrinema hispanicum]RZV06615.1 cell division control protein 6 [Natrinema hispanicum]SEU09546.1 cell division control protein 6 [Natrinema hispanicum]
MGRERRTEDSNDHAAEKARESLSTDPENSSSTTQTTFEADSDTTDPPLSEMNDESGGISIRERLQTESSGGVFANKDLVRSDTIIDEDRIVGRDDQLARVVDNLKPVLQDEGIPDMLLSGPSGTGKSLIIHAVCKQIVELCESQGKVFGVLSINCEGPKTADRAVYRLVKAAADDLGVDPGVPQTGVSTDQKLERLYELMREHYDGVIFILDEIDLLEGPYQEAEYNSLIYQLSRARKLADFDGPISLTTITNYADFMKNLNSRAQSSYNPDDIFFDDYDATQLRSILKYRRDAFKPESLSDDVIPLVAAFGSQTHGDARKAIDLLRWAGELAERRGADTVTESDVRKAQEKYTENRKLRHISGISTQKKLSTYAVAATAHYTKENLEWIPAGPAFKTYQFIADTMDAEKYSRETFVNHVTEQSTYGVLDFERRGRGRGRGVHMYFSLSEDPETIMETIREDSRFADLAHEDPTISSVVRERMKKFRSNS